MQRLQLRMSSGMGLGWLAAATLAALSTAGSANAGTVLASNYSSSSTLSSFFYGAGFSGSTSNGTYTNEAAAQEFTAQASGVVGQITATVDQFEPGNVPLIVTITDANGSVPGTALGSLSFAPNQVSKNVFSQPSTFDFSSAHVSLTAGHDYFVTFSVATPIGGSTRYEATLLTTTSPNLFGFAAINSKDEGATWNTSPISNEVGLNILEATNGVPEPGSLALLATGLVLAGGIASRRKLSRA